jgi:putative intracellular protease/amidase
MYIKPFSQARSTCYVFLSEKYADWEVALLMAGLHQFSEVDVVTFSLHNEPVLSMGNLAVLPDLSLSEVDPADIDFLVLPGSPLWELNENQGVAALVSQVLALGKGVGAICGATLLLAREGWLDNCLHTSNHKDYILQNAPEYMGMEHYSDEPVTRDGPIITAGGPFSFQFAREVFLYFGLGDYRPFREWFQYFEMAEIVMGKMGIFSPINVS